MTELDTAAIRAEWYSGMNIMDAKDCIRALCDALDAARAERHYAEVERDESRWALLAEQAATLDQVSEWQHRAEAAEARIAAACAEPALDIAYVDVLLAKIGELSSCAEAAEAALEGCQRAHDITDAKRVQAEVDRDRWNLVADLVGVECLAAKARIAAALAVYREGHGTRCAATMAATLTEGTYQ